jgi:hypothetical protein
VNKSHSGALMSRSEATQTSNVVSIDASDIRSFMDLD